MLLLAIIAYGHIPDMIGRYVWVLFLKLMNKKIVHP